MTRTAVALAILAALSSGGCGTVITLSDPVLFPNQIYAGTVASATATHGGGLLDVPFSLAADTLVLPYTIPRTIYNLSDPSAYDRAEAAREDRTGVPRRRRGEADTRPSGERPSAAPP